MVVDWQAVAGWMMAPPRLRRRPGARAPYPHRCRALLLAALVAAGCGDGEPGTAPPGAPVPTTLAITPSSAVLAALGQTVRLTATVRDQTGAVMSGVGVNWASSDAGIVTVDPAGLVRAVGNGATNITATVQGGGASGGAAITVSQAVTALTVSPDQTAIDALETLQLTAQALDANENPVAGVDFSWRSDDESVATVSAAGLVTAVAPGSATISVQASEAGLTATARIAVNVSGKFALVTLYNATGGSRWTISDNWLTDAPVGQWHGVTADADGRVIELDLSRIGLEGRLPEEFAHLTSLRRLNLSYNRLAGEIPAYLAEFTELEELRLAVNALTGPIPVELSGLTGLRVLDLSNDLFEGRNRLTERIPPEIAQLDDLEVLNLAFNSLTGPIPEELAGLRNLTVLDIEQNDLSGPIPPGLTGLSGLEVLSLAGNRLTGAIPPGLGDLSNLRDLKLHMNQLSGPIPPSLGKLRLLARLSLCCNALTGPIPPELGNLSSVGFLGLQVNELSGSVPSELGRLSALRHLYLFTNADLRGPLPRELVNLRLVTFDWIRTALCSPSDADFQDWLGSIPRHQGEGVCS